MRRLLSAIVLGSALLSLSIAVTAAASNRATATLHPPMHTKMMAIAHAAGSATISYTMHDATIKLTTERLPQPAAIHESAYVLWLVNGMHKVNAGSFMVHGGMGAKSLMTMDVTFRQLVVTGEKSATVKHASGPVVLSGAVMRG